MKSKTSVSLSPTCKKLLDAIAKKLGIPASNVIEIAVRRLAEIEGVK